MGSWINEKRGFSKYRGEIFKSGNDKEACSTISSYINFEVTPKQNFNSNLTDVVKDFMDSKSDYFLELQPF